MAGANFTEMFLVPKDIYDKIMSLNCQSDRAHLISSDASISGSRKPIFNESVPRPSPGFPDFNPRHDTNLPHVFPEPMFPPDPSFHSSEDGSDPTFHPPVTPTTTTTDDSSSHLTSSSFDMDYDGLSEISSKNSVPPYDTGNLTPPFNTSRISNNSVPPFDDGNLTPPLNRTENSNISVPPYDEGNLTPPFSKRGDMTFDSSSSSINKIPPNYTSTPAHSVKSVKSHRSKMSIDSDISSINKRSPASSIKSVHMGSVGSAPTTSEHSKRKRKMDTSNNSKVPYKFGRNTEKKKKTKKPETYPKVDEKFKKEKISRPKEKEKLSEAAPYPKVDKKFSKESLKPDKKESVRPEKKESFKKPKDSYPSMDKKYAKEKVNSGFKIPSEKEAKKDNSFSKKGSPKLSKTQQQQAKITEDIMRFPTNSPPHIILGVNAMINIKDLKKTYKSLSLLLHPDKNKHELAHHAFTRFQNAYDTMLSELELNEKFMRDFRARSNYEEKQKEKQKEEEELRRRQRSDFSYSQHYKPTSDHQDKQKRETERIMRADVNNHFQVFDIPETANLVELKAKYYLLANLIDPRNNLHPDALFAFTILQDSYKILYDRIVNKMREDYGTFGARPRTPRGPPTNQRNTSNRSNLRPPPNPYGFKWYNN